MKQNIKKEIAKILKQRENYIGQASKRLDQYDKKIKKLMTRRK